MSVLLKVLSPAAGMGGPQPFSGRLAARAHAILIVCRVTTGNDAANLEHGNGGMKSGFNIADIHIPGRVLTAPMTGVSDLPFRRAASKCGAPYVATEMVACET